MIYNFVSNEKGENLGNIQTIMDLKNYMEQNNINHESREFFEC